MMKRILTYSLTGAFIAAAFFGTAWFGLDAARTRLHLGQRPLIDALVAAVGG